MRAGCTVCKTRFGNVVAANILSLTRGRDRVRSAQIRRKMMEETALRSVPFLGAFPNLQRIRIGYIYHDDYNDAIFFMPYACSVVDYPRGHQQIYKSLLWSLCGAFKSRLLKPDLDIGDVVDANPASHYDDQCRGYLPFFERPHPIIPCLCRTVCETFPFKNVFKCSASCVGDVTRFKLIAKRPGGADFLRDSKRFLQLFKGRQQGELEYMLEDMANGSESSGIGVAFRKLQEVKGSGSLFVYCNQRLLGMMELLKERYGCGPTMLEKEPILEAIYSRKRCEQKYPLPVAFAKSSLDSLIKLGFKLSHEDFSVVLDDESDKDLGRKISRPAQHVIIL